MRRKTVNRTPKVKASHTDSSAYLEWGSLRHFFKIPCISRTLDCQQKKKKFIKKIKI